MISILCNTLANYSSKNGLTWFDSFKTQTYELTDEIKGVFDEIGKLTPDSITNYNKDGWEPFIKNTNVADETLKKFLNDANQTDKSLAAFKQYPDVVNKTGKAFNFAALGAKAFNMALNAAIMFAVVKGIELAAKALDNYVHRLDNAKEAFADTESDLSSVKTEIETTTEKIKELEAMDSLSITDKEDLQRLKDQNEELRIRQQYLEKQKKYDTDRVAELTKEKYNSQYTDKSGNIQDDIDKYRSLYGQSQTQNSYASTNGNSAIPGTMSYAPGMAVNDYNIESQSLANLIAQYQYYQEEKAKAISTNDEVGIEKYNAKLEETNQKLMDNRSTLQGFSDDLAGQASPELDSISEKLKLIDNLLLSPGQNLVNFINSDSLKEDKDKLVELADAGKLTTSILADNFSDIDRYLKENGLTIEDLISVVKAYRDELGTIDEAMNKSLSKQEVITNINSLSEGFESLDEIMKSISDKDNPFDYALLDDKNFKEKFGDLGESYTDFIEKVSSSPKDIQATQSAFDDLVTTWIDSSGVLDGLTDENANLATAMLQNMGVANAEEVVTNRLAIAQAELAAEKYYNANASDTLNNATISEIDAFVNSGIAAGISEQALAELALQKLAVNDVKIDTSSDIDQVIGLANAAGASATVLSKLAQAKAIMAKAEAGALNGSVGDLRQYESAQAMLAEIENGTFDFQTTLDPEKYKKTVYTGGTKTNKSGGSGSKKDKTDTSKDIDWIDRQLKLLEEKRSQLVNKISDTYSDFSSTTHDQILELDKTLINEYTNAVNQYQSEYDKAVSKISTQNKAKIENGSMSVDTLSGKELENVQAAIDAYDKLTGTQEKQSEAHKTLLDDIKSKYDDISKSIENENSKLKDSNSILESQMEYYKSAGIVVDSSYYNRLIQNTSGLISNTRDTISNKRAELRDLLANGVSTSSQEYLDLKSEIADAETNVYALKKAQEEYNNQLKQMPIDHLSTIISMYQDIGTAISDWGAEYEAAGGKLDANYYQRMISNSTKVTDSLREQASLIEDTMSEHDVGSDRYLELYQRLKSVNSEMSTTVQNMRKLNEEMLKLPLENIGGFSSELQKVADGLSSVQDEYDSVISAVTGAIKNQIDLLNEQSELETENRQSEIDALKEKLDLLDKENEYRKLQYDLEQKQFELEKARNQKTNRVNKIAHYYSNVVHENSYNG